MLNEKTCLILGAGASRPYLLPTSRELRHILLGGAHADAAFTRLGWDILHPGTRAFDKHLAADSRE
jgi:hypothetical protein